MDKYDFIDQYRHIHSVSDLCQALNVSRSAYYNREQVGKREIKDLELFRLILEIHSQYQSMGLDLMYHYLKNENIKVGRKRLHRIMKKYNIHSCRHKAFKCTTNSNHSKPIAPNLLHQYFNAHAPNVAILLTFLLLRAGSILPLSKTSALRRSLVIPFPIELMPNLSVML